ncbi:MAG: hypothetical protein LBG73_06475 [Spirochaetaceae bacterium]|jgi:hypothetical protein|nr:hypothetical protein [Spirochaetaceae bacterium]
MAKFGEKMKEFLEQSAQTSKELASKAGAKAQNLGEQGVLLFDIKKLKGEVEKQINLLGQEAYHAFMVQQQETVNAYDSGTKKILDEIASLQQTIEKKEAELQEKKEK